MHKWASPAIMPKGNYVLKYIISNTTIYNYNLGNMYIKMISVTLGYTDIIYLAYLQVYINIRYKAAYHYYLV